MNKRHLVVVEWDDISSLNDWYNEKDINSQPIRCFTVGWVLKSDRKNLRITSTRSEHGKCSDVCTIPRGCIRSKRILE